jgi:phosphoesterase RecJ-like protein
MFVDEKTAAKLLAEQGDILIFAHRKPDGDTIGSAFGLMRALASLGKRVRVECADPMIVGRMEKIFGSYKPEDFAPAFFVAVDIADTGLLAGVHEPYGGRVDLCIDHHKSNSGYAEKTLLDAGAAATAEIVYRLVIELGAKPTKEIADALYVGITSDTGCFRHANTTAETHEVAAELIRWGADVFAIDKLLYATKTRGRLAVDRFVLQTMEYHCDGRCALLYLPADVYTVYQVDEEDLDGVSAFPRTIEGVLVGVTVRDKGDGTFRISLRTGDPVDASKICAVFGGGGHKNAAGCIMSGELAAVKTRLMGAIHREMAELGL